MKLIILGSGSIIPVSDRNPAGYAVRVGGSWLLFDLGAGNLRRLAQAQLSMTHDIHQIFLSHYHLDHIGDLQNLFFALRLPNYRREKPLQIYGPPGLLDLVRGFRGLWGKWIEPKGYPLQLRELAIGETLVGDGYKLTAFEALHGGEQLHAFSYRLEETSTGKVLCYSGDTDIHAPLVECCKDADLAILECSTPDAHKVPGHLSPTWCGRVAAEAEIQTCVLTHLYPECFLPSADQEDPDAPAGISPEESLRWRFQREAGKEPLIGQDLQEIDLEDGG